MPALPSEVVFEIGPQAISQSGLIEHLKGLPSKLQDFLSVLIRTGLSTIDTVTAPQQKSEPRPAIFNKETFVEQLKAEGHRHSDSLISTRISELRGLNVLTSERISTAKARIHHHKILDLYQLAELPPISSSKMPEEKITRRRTKEMVDVQLDILRGENFNVLESPKAEKGYHDRLLHGILDVGMRLSSRDSRREITVNTEIVGSPLTVTSKVIGETGDLATLVDQRCQRAIISLVKNEIDKRVSNLKKSIGILDYPDNSFDEYQLLKEKIDNLFAINIYTLCEEVKLPKRYVNAKNLVAMMERLANTVYDIDASQNDWFKRTFSLSGKSEKIRIQFLQNFEIANESPSFLDLFGVEENDVLPHVYTFSLDPRIFFSILDPDRQSIFLSHSELAGERSGITHRFYNWCRAYITGGDKGYLKDRRFTFREMHKHLTPAARYDNFHSYFLRMLEKFVVGEWDIHGKTTSKIYGYLVYYDNTQNEATISIERDINDPIIGNNSTHQRLLRRQREEVHCE